MVDIVVAKYIETQKKSSIEKLFRRIKVEAPKAMFNEI
jgi:hypothetical protein